MQRRGVLLGLTASGFVRPALADANLWSALMPKPRVAVMRHALAPGTGDPPNFRLGDCRTQRNLDAAGRAQARAVGAAFRANGIGFDRILTSSWCRCRETAELLDLGPVDTFALINTFYAGRGDGADQTRALRTYLVELPEDSATLLVTHQVNITALTGAAVSSGEVFALDIRSATDIRVRASAVPVPAR